MSSEKYGIVTRSRKKKSQATDTTEESPKQVTTGAESQNQRPSSQKDNETKEDQEEGEVVITKVRNNRTVARKMEEEKAKNPKQAPVTIETEEGVSDELVKLTEETEVIIDLASKYISKSWITMTNFGDAIRYVPIAKRLPSRHWYSLDYQARTQATGYDAPILSFEVAEIRRTIELVIERYEIDDPRDLAWKMTRGLAKEVQRKSFENDVSVQQSVSTFMRMAKTEREGLLRTAVSEMERNKFHACWIAGQQIFGAVEDSCDNNTIIYKSTESKPLDFAFWSTYKDTTNEQFSKNDFTYVTSPSAWKTMEKVNNRHGSERKSTSVEEWEMTIKIILTAYGDEEQDQECIKFFVKLANTPPENVPGWDPVRQQIENNPFSMAWVAVHRVWGKTWTKEVRFDAKTKDNQNPPSTMLARRKKKPRQEATAAPPMRNIFFIHRDNTTPTEYVLNERWHRTYTTFVKIRLPPIPEGGVYFRHLDDKAGEILELLDAVWDVDPTVALAAWHSYTEKDPIGAETETQPTKAFLEPYVERLYGARGKGGSYIRARLLHTMPLNELLSYPPMKQIKQDRGIMLYTDKIQARQIKYLGWFAGSINSRHAINDLEWALKQQPETSKNNIKNIEIRIGVVNNDATFQRVAEEDRVFAMHLYSDAESAKIVTNTAVALYPAKPASAYPMGRHMRFVPNVNDSNFVHAPDAYSKAERLKRKQGIFHSRLRTMTTKSIKQLNRPLSRRPYPTLTEIIMAWQSPLFEGEKLFVAVEELYGTTTFHYLSKNERAVKIIVPLLEIILEAEFGEPIWEWFDKPIHPPKVRFQYSRETKKIMPIEVDNDDDNEEWSMGVDDLDDELSEAEMFQVDVGMINMEGIELTGGLDDASIGNLGTIRETTEEDAESVSTSATAHTANSSITESIVTRHDNHELDDGKPKQAEDTGTGNQDNGTEVSSITATVATKLDPKASTPDGMQAEEITEGGINTNIERLQPRLLALTGSTGGKKVVDNEAQHRDLLYKDTHREEKDKSDDISMASSVTATVATKYVKPRDMSIDTPRDTGNENSGARNSVLKEGDTEDGQSCQSSVTATVATKVVPPTGSTQEDREEASSQQSSVTASVVTKVIPADRAKTTSEKSSANQPTTRGQQNDTVSTAGHTGQAEVSSVAAHPGEARVPQKVSNMITPNKNDAQQSKQQTPKETPPQDRPKQNEHNNTTRPGPENSKNG